MNESSIKNKEEFTQWKRIISRTIRTTRTIRTARISRITRTTRISRTRRTERTSKEKSGIERYRNFYALIYSINTRI